MAIEGAIEVISNNISTSQRVKVASLASIPAVLAANFGVSGATSVTPVKVGSVTSAGTWTGTKGGKPASARLWTDIPFEQTAIGKALAAGEIDPLNPGPTGE